MESVWLDIRYAMRALHKSPWFAVLAIVTLAISIAVNTAIFGAVNGLILRPFPAPHSERLVVLGFQQGGDSTLQSFSYPDFVDMRERASSSIELAAHRITLSGRLRVPSFHLGDRVSDVDSTRDGFANSIEFRS